MIEQSVDPICCRQPSRTPLTVLFLALVCLFFGGCSASSSSSSSSSTTPGALDTITITASATSLAVTNTSATFSASAADSSGVAITGLTFTWNSSNPSVATVNPSTLAITATAPGFTEITATSQGITSNAVGITVTAPLSGQYAFLIQGFDDFSGNQIAMIGSFVTDGNGNITNGLVDINGPASGNSATLNFALPAEETLTGTYTSSIQNQGGIKFLLGNGPTLQFRYVASTFSGGVPTAGKIIEVDDSTGSNSNRDAGVFYLQSSADFALSAITGPYALQFFGQQAAAGSWYVRTGAFTGDGNGNFTTGEFVTNSSGTVSNPTSFTATFRENSTTTDSTTFGQFPLAFNSGISQTGYLYIVSSTQALFMEADAESVDGIEAGQILAQSTSTFSAASLNAATVEYEQGLGSAAPPTPTQPLAAIGLITFSNGTTATVSRDLDDSGTLTSPQTLSLTIPSVAANGRAVLMNGASPFATVYLVGANEGFIMSNTASATMGFFQPQAAGPFSIASIAGMYAGGTPPPTVLQPPTDTNGIPIVSDAEIISSGNGVATITSDYNLHGSGSASLLENEQGSVSLTVAANGRATDNFGNIYYVIGPTNFLMLKPVAVSASTPIILVFQQ